MSTQGFSAQHMLDDAAIRGTLKGAFRKTYDTKAPKWKACGFEQDSTVKPFEEFSSFSGISLAPRREEFSQTATDVPKQNYTMRIRMLEYAVMIPVSDSAVRFLKRGMGSVREFIRPAEMAAESMGQTNEVLASDVFGNAFDTTNFPGQDGVSLVSASHKLGRGGTASNLIGTVSFSQSSLEAAIIQADRFPDDVGLQVGAASGKRLLVIPPEYRFEAKRILNSQLQSDNANHAINALKDEDLEPVPNRYLPSTTNWFIVNTGEKLGLHAIFETEPKMIEFGDEKTHSLFYEAYEMVGFGFGLNWRRVQGSNF